MTGSLHNRRIVNTRAAHQAKALDRLLRDHGAIPVAYPCIAIVPPADARALAASLDRLAAGEFDWLVLTSSNTVYALIDQLHGREIDLRRVQVAAVGPSTATAIERLLGEGPAFVPQPYTGADLATTLPVTPGDRVFLPASEIARDDVAEILRQRGATVEVVAAYRTVTGTGGADLPRMLSDGQLDALSFCSSSAMDGFVTRLSGEIASLERARDMPTVCIGPSTHATALAHGFRSATVADVHSLEGLVAGLQHAFSVQPQGGSRWL